jgi:hypothetical protein
MTEFADQTTSPKRRFTKRRTLLATGGGSLAVAAALAGVVLSGGGTPAYAVTQNHNGTVTVAVHDKSGFVGANAKLAKDGESQVVVVPIEAGCPAPKAPAVSPKGHSITVGGAVSKNGSATFSATGIPAGDIVAVGMQTTGQGRSTESVITSPPAPTCLPPASAPTGNGAHSGTAVTNGA